MDWTTKQQLTRLVLTNNLLTSDRLIKDSSRWTGPQTTANKASSEMASCNAVFCIPSVNKDRRLFSSGQRDSKSTKYL
jgi:hypothetical protein